MLDLVSRYFVPTVPEGSYRRAHYVLLAALVAVGAWLRFWGLGNVGLHGDEETMAMSAMAILHRGLPYLPGGMLYPRGMVQTYLMAGSVWLFGQSEWALRFPSAVVGSTTALAAFFMGRRFLSPAYNLGFVATIALLPALIEDSQTARMYIFFVTLVIVFGTCLFRWERDQRFSSLLLAWGVWVAALLFQQLAAFVAPLFLFPGLSRQSWRQLLQGSVALAGAVVMFALDNAWLSANYPGRSERVPRAAAAPKATDLQVLTAGHEWLLVATLVAVVALGLLFLLRTKGEAWQRVAPPLVVVLGLLAMALLQYHVGVILLLLGTIAWLRTSALPRPWLVAAFILAAVMAAAHLTALSATGVYHGRQVIGALVGQPSVWPTLRFLVYAPASAVLFGVAVLLAFARLAQSRQVPMLFLFFGMAVWAPLFAIGFFAAYIPPRYAEGQLAYFLMCVFAGVAYLLREVRLGDAITSLAPARLAVVALTAAALVNPVALARGVDPQYGYYPDHKGAADYLKSLPVKPGDVLIAEDVLEQTYYLGKVDYWLSDIDTARLFAIVRNGRLLDEYTDTPIIGTGAELKRVLESDKARNVYVIGSGENFVNGHRNFRGHGIAEELQSNDLVPVYHGRDGKTVVWRNRR